MTLYEYVNTITGIGYAGKTIRSLKIRDSEHKYDLKNNKHCNPKFQHAFNKHGKDCFKLIVRATFDTLEELNKAEKELLEVEKHRLYNIIPGAKWL